MRLALSLFDMCSIDSVSLNPPHINWQFHRKGILRTLILIGFGVVPMPVYSQVFKTPATYGSGGYDAYSVTVADVNGDGKPDLIVANACSNIHSCADGGFVGVLLGNGNGTFQTAVTYASGGQNAYSVAVADVNGDGKPDLIVANGCATISCANGSVGVLFGNGDGTFQTAVTYASGGQYAYSVAVADVNGDGKPDVVVTNGCAGSTNCANTSVGVLFGNGDGTFQAAVTYASGGQAYSVAVADVNGDGKPDLVVANRCDLRTSCGNGSVGVLLGNGDGTFQTAVTYGSGGFEAWGVVVADVNGDGKPDLVVANACANSDSCANSNGSVGVLFGNGDGTFQTAVPYGSGGYDPFSVALADVNGDGKPDLIVANACGNNNSSCSKGSVGVLLANGDGTFQTALTYISGGEAAWSVAVADVNGDGKPDIVVANRSGNSNSGSVGVLINTGLALTLSTKTLTFGTQGLSDTSSAKTVAVTNNNSGAIALSGNAITGTNANAFAISATTCGTSLAARASCTISVTFTPAADGAITATLSISNGVFESPQNVALTGTGVAQFTVSVAHINFGKQVSGTTSAAKSVTLTNNTSAARNISSIIIGGTNPANFSQSATTCGTSLNGHSSCTISFTFSPSATAPYAATVNIMDGASNSPQMVGLTGMGVAP